MLMPALAHGGTDAAGSARFDFSTNSNACGPCPLALEAVQQADATRYPDPAYTGLRQALAAFHGVTAERVLLAASASEWIHRISAWTARQGGQTVCLPAHHYGDYAQAAQAWGLQAVADPAHAALLWACEPSSPLGQAQAGLGQWARALQPHQTLVLDCAYAPLRLSGQPSLDAAGLNQVWQLFTPNKALGLTGVRAAYVIAPLADGAGGAIRAVPSLVQLAPSWPVGAHGVAMLQAWLQPQVQAWLAASLPILRGWKTRQTAVLQTLGWSCLPSDANFFCARPALPPGMDLPQWLVALRAHGIKLRDASPLGLPGRVRVGVLAPKAQDALCLALGRLDTDRKEREKCGP